MGSEEGKEGQLLWLLSVKGKGRRRCAVCHSLRLCKLYSRNALDMLCFFCVSRSELLPSIEFWLQRGLREVASMHESMEGMSDIKVIYSFVQGGALVLLLVRA